MTVAVLTDSASALPSDIASAAGITVVPIHLTVGDDAFLDGEIDTATLLARAHEGIATSGPTPGDFLAAIDEAADEVVIVTVAADLSSTFESASVAARGRAVRVVDSGTAAGAQALVALGAARMAAGGADGKAVAEVATRLAGEVHLVGSLETIDYLVRGGRVPSAVGAVAGRLGVRPLFELRHGRIHRLPPAFSRRAAHNRLVARLHRTARAGQKLHAVALHSGALQDAEQLLDHVERLHPKVEAFVAEFGPGMVGHAGPGVVGLAWRWEP